MNIYINQFYSVSVSPSFFLYISSFHLPSISLSLPSHLPPPHFLLLQRSYSDMFIKGCITITFLALSIAFALFKFVPNVNTPDSYIPLLFAMIYGQLNFFLLIYLNIINTSTSSFKCLHKHFVFSLVGIFIVSLAFQVIVQKRIISFTLFPYKNKSSNVTTVPVQVLSPTFTLSFLHYLSLSISN